MSTVCLITFPVVVGAAVRPSSGRVLQQLMRNTDIPLSSTKNCRSVSPQGAKTIGDYLAGVLEQQADPTLDESNRTTVEVGVTPGPKIERKATWEAEVEFRISDAESPYSAGVRFLMTSAQSPTLIRGSLDCGFVN